MTEDRSSRSIVVPGALLVAALTTWGVVSYFAPPEQANPPRLAPPAEIVPWEVIDPAVVAHERASRDAADRLIQRIEDNFDVYAAGIEPFVTDVMRWRTRGRILWASVRDFRSDEEVSRTERIIQGLFEEHIINEARFANDMDEAFGAFREDLVANRAALLANIKAAIAPTDLQDLHFPDYVSFESDVLEDLRRFAQGRAEESVYVGLVAYVASEVAIHTALQIVRHVLRSAAISAASAGGFAAGGGAVGAGGGTAIGGPPGTAIGFVIGLGVGAAIDWILSTRQSRRLTEQLRDQLDALRTGLLDGTEEHDGMRKAIEEFCADLRYTELSALERIFLRGAP